MKKYFRVITATVICYVTLIIAFALTSTVSVAGPAYTGSGTEANPYVVSNATEFIEVLNLYNHQVLLQA